MGRLDRMNQEVTVKAAPEPKPEVESEAMDKGTKEPMRAHAKVPKVVPGKVPSSVETFNEEFAAEVTRVIRWPGDKGQNLRMSEEERERLNGLVRFFEDRKYPTDRTQIIRAWINYGMMDFDTNGEDSVIVKILDWFYSH